MRRVSITEIVQHTGLSRATVDRVMNNRGRVHPRTREVVEEALNALKSPEAVAALAGPPADFVSRVGRGMAAQLKLTWEQSRAAGDFHDMYQAEETELLEVIARLCADVSRPLIITAKNTQRLTDLLRKARARGKRIVTLVSDLAPDSRDCFVGIDNRAAGQTAAYLIGRALGGKPAKAAVVVGDTSFRCHEEREIGFRNRLRANFPNVVIAGEARGQDSPALTRESVLRLLAEQPDLAAIYNVGGGNTGLVQAIQEAGQPQNRIVVVHEMNHITVPLLKEGRVDFAIAGNPADQLKEAIRLASTEKPGTMREVTIQDFYVFTRFNVPGFAQST
jgi:LacI family transcriptional regulator